VVSSMVCPSRVTVRGAEIIGTSEQNARQLTTRAGRHVAQRRPLRACREQREELATRFFAATEEGDLQGLEKLLAHDVAFAATAAATRPQR